MLFQCESRHPGDISLNHPARYTGGTRGRPVLGRGPGGSRRVAAVPRGTDSPGERKISSSRPEAHARLDPISARNEVLFPHLFRWFPGLRRGLLMLLRQVWAPFFTSSSHSCKIQTRADSPGPTRWELPLLSVKLTGRSKAPPADTPGRRRPCPPRTALRPQTSPRRDTEDT